MVLNLNKWRNKTEGYDAIRDAILTCARKPTGVSLIYRTEYWIMQQVHQGPDVQKSYDDAEVTIHLLWTSNLQNSLRLL